MVAAAVQADLPVDLVLVQLAYAAHQVAFQHDHLTGALADGFVDCRSSTWQTQKEVQLCWAAAHRLTRRTGRADAIIHSKTHLSCHCVMPTWSVICCLCSAGHICMFAVLRTC